MTARKAERREIPEAVSYILYKKDSKEFYSELEASWVPYRSLAAHYRTYGAAEHVLSESLHLTSGVEILTEGVDLCDPLLFAKQMEEAMRYLDIERWYGQSTHEDVLHGVLIGVGKAWSSLIRRDWEDFRANGLRMAALGLLVAYLGEKAIEMRARPKRPSYKVTKRRG